MEATGPAPQAMVTRVALRGRHPSAPIPVQGPPLGDGVRVPLGETGASVFPVVLGAAEFGWRLDIGKAHRVMDAYRAAGGNAIHTADGYSAGQSEHVVGQWAHTRGIRDELVVTVRVGDHPDHPGLDSVNLVRAVEASLARLRTDRIDVLSLDAGADKDTPLEHVLATVGWLIETGKVRAVGGFGFSAAQLVEARILAAAGYPRLQVADIPYNILRRRELDADLPLVLAAQGIAVTASRALEHGFLAGAHRSRSGLGRTVRGRQLAAHMNRRGKRTLAVLDAIGSELSIPIASVALAWLLAQRLITAAVVNASDEAQIGDLTRAIGVQLSRAHMTEIARVAG